MSKKNSRGDDVGETGGEALTRRAALKRIAAAVAGVAVGGAVLAESKPAAAAGYVSIEGSYVNTVYGDYQPPSPSYNDQFTYYTSYSSHQTYVPPP